MSQSSLKISVLINLLEQYSKVHFLSLSLTIGSVFLFLILAALFEYSNVSILINLMIILLGIYEVYLAIRIGFDISLFRQLESTDKQNEQQLINIDNALLSLKLISKKNMDRNLDDRIGGLKKLFLKQIMSCSLQLIMIIVLGFSLL